MLGEIKKGFLQKIILKLTFKKEFARPRGKKAFLNHMFKNKLKIIASYLLLYFSLFISLYNTL